MADVDLSERRPFWDDVRIDRLKTLWAAGDSCSQIARELGGVTRNSIIGKAHRLGLSPRTTGLRKSEAPRVRASRAEPKPKHNQTPPELHAKRAQAVDDLQAKFAQEAEGITADAFDAAIPKRQRKTIMQLENRHCRFPVGTPGTSGFFYCGGMADNAAGQVYCSAHSARAFNGLPKKPRREFHLK